MAKKAPRKGMDPCLCGLHAGAAGEPQTRDGLADVLPTIQEGSNSPVRPAESSAVRPKDVQEA